MRLNDFRPYRAQAPIYRALSSAPAKRLILYYFKIALKMGHPSTPSGLNGSWTRTLFQPSLFQVRGAYVYVRTYVWLIIVEYTDIYSIRTP
jgi:hypothetical protein